MFRTRSSHVAMDPNGRITWEKVELASGNLYLPEATNTNRNQVVHLLTTNPTGQEILKGNSGGEVYLPTHTDQDIVVKKFMPVIYGGSDVSDRGNLPDLRANVTLGAGLVQLDQTNNLWRFRGVNILGAFVATSEEDSPDKQHAQWVMSRALTVSTTQAASDFNKLPDGRERRHIYDEALAVVCAPRSAKNLVIHFDDHGNNLMVEALPEYHGQAVVQQGLVTKIDVTAGDGFNF